MWSTFFRARTSASTATQSVSSRRRSRRGSRANRSSRGAPRSGLFGARLRLEPLEDRTLLSAVLWTGGHGNDWNTPENWSTGAVPQSGDDVTIDLAGAAVTISSGAQSVNSLNNQAALAISSGASLSVAAGGRSGGAITAEAGTSLEFGGNWTITAPITSAGSVQFWGGTTQVKDAYAAGSTSIFARGPAADVTFSGDVTSPGGTSVTGYSTARFTGSVHSLGGLYLDNRGTLDLSEAKSVDAAVLALPSLFVRLASTLIAPYDFTVSGPVTLAGAGSLLDASGRRATLEADGGLEVCDAQAQGFTLVNPAGQTARFTGLLTLENGGFENHGVLELAGGGMATSWGTPTAVFTNDGQVVMDGQGTAELALPVTNTGTIQVNSGLLALGGRMWSLEPRFTSTSSDTISAAAGTALEFGGRWIITAPITSAGHVQFWGSRYAQSGPTQVKASYQADSTTVIWSCDVTFAADVTNANGLSLTYESTASFTGAVHSLGAIDLQWNGCTVDFSQAASVDPAVLTLPSLNLANGTTLIAPYSFHVSGAFTCSGTLTGGGTLEADAGMQVSGGYLSGFTLVNPQGQTAVFTSGVNVDHGIFVNHGLLELDSESNGAYAGLYLASGALTGAFSNDGQVVSDGPGIGILGLPITNTSTIQVDSGLLVLGGRMWSLEPRFTSTSSGAISAAAGTALEFGGRWIITAPITSAGHVQFWGSRYAQSGPTQVKASYQADSTTVIWSCDVTFAADVTNANGLSLTYESTASFTGAVHSLGAIDLQWNGCTVDFSQAASVDPAALTLPSLNLANGTTLIAPYSFHVSGAFTCSGTLTGGGTLEADAGMQVSGGYLSGFTLVNPQGQTAVFTSGVNVDHGIFVNHGLLELDSESNGAYAGLYLASGALTGAFSNDGQVVSDGPGIGILGLPITNTSTIQVDSGLLVLGGRMWSLEPRFTSTSSGAISAAAGTALEFGGRWIITAPITSAGHVQFWGSRYAQSGPTQVKASYQADSTTVIWSCDVTFAADVTNANGLSLTYESTASFTGAVHSLGAIDLQWNGCTVDFSQAASVDPAALTLPSLNLANGTTLIAPYSFHVSGAFTCGSGTLTGGGSLEANGGMQISSGYLTGFTLINPVGQTALLTSLVRVDGGGFVNHGLLELDSEISYWAAGLQLDSDVSPGSFSNDGQVVQKGSGPGYLILPVTNTGTVQVDSGLLQLGVYTQTAGVTRLDGGSIAGTLDIEGGTLDGSGPIYGSVLTSGHTSPGLTTAPSPVGDIQVQGDYIQKPTGALDIDLGGLAAGQRDQLDVTGSVTLAGQLNVSLVNFFTPGLGDTFDIVDNQGAQFIHGQFDGLDEGAVLSVGYQRFRISYQGGTGNDVTLTAINHPVFWDGGGDGQSWNDPFNWSDDQLPGPGDDAIIDVPGDITVALSSGTASINSLDCRETLVVSGGATLDLAASSQVVALTLSGATLSGSGDLTVTNQLNWSNGSMVAGIPGARTVIAAGASAVLAGSPGGAPTLDGRVLENDGSCNLETVPGYSVGLRLVNGAAMDNYGTFLTSGGGNAVLGSSGDPSEIFVNHLGGQVLCQTYTWGGWGSWLGPAAPTMINNGTVVVDSGAVLGWTNGESTGCFEVHGSLTLGGGVLAASSQVIGDGSVTLANCTVAGTYTVTGNSNLWGTTFTPTSTINSVGTSLALYYSVDFGRGRGSLALQSLSVGNGPAELYDTTITTVDFALWGTGAAITCGDLTATGHVDWANGSMAAGIPGARTVIAAGASAVLAGSPGGAPTLDGRVLENDGSCNLETVPGYSVGLRLVNGAAVDNYGTFLTSGGGNAVLGSSGDPSETFVNHLGGQVLCQTYTWGGWGSWLGPAAPTMINNGTVVVDSGAVLGWTNGESTGCFEVHGSLTLGGGVLAASSQVIGDGSVTLANCTVAGTYTVTGNSNLWGTTFTPTSTINSVGTSLALYYSVDFGRGRGSLALQSLSVGNGPAELYDTTITTVDFALWGTGAAITCGDLTATGHVDWANGSMAAGIPGARTVIAAGASAVLAGSPGGAPTLDGRVLENDGSCNLETVPGYSVGLRLVNGAAVDNYGTFLTSGGGNAVLGSSGDPSETFVNHLGGQVLCQTYTWGGWGSWLGPAAPTMINNGTVVVDSGAVLGWTNGESKGSFEVHGQLDLSGELLEGEVNLDGGSIISSLHLQGGTITGSGPIYGSVLTSGHTSPGLTTAPSPVGDIQVQGDYTQYTAGALDIDLGGLAADQCDQLEVTGSVTLAGRLNVSLVNSFTPALGNTFVIVDNAGTGAILGQFDGLPEGATFAACGTGFRITYRGGTEHNDVVLTAITVDTSTTVTPSDDHPVYGDPLTFTATVAALSAGAGVPGGTVEFYVDDVLLDSELLGSNGVAVSQPVSMLSAGDHVITVSYVGADIFNPSGSLPLTLTVSPAPLTVTPKDVSRVYGDPNPTLVGTIEGIKNNDAITALYLSAADTTSSVGTYTIHAVLSAEAVLGNYDITYNTAALTITARPITATADATSKTYGNADPALTYQITSGSLAFSDAFTGALTRNPGENVGSYAITQGTLSLTDNYDLTYVGVDLTIGKRSVTITADAKSKTYGNADPGLTYQITTGSLVTGDTFTGSLTRAAGEDVGSYAITQGTLSLSDNYALSYVGANLEVTARSITVTANNATKTYGQTVTFAGTEFTPSGLINGDTIASVTLTCAGAVASASVGSYDIFPAAAVGSGLGNYFIDYHKGALTVTYDASTGFLQPVALTGNAPRQFKQGSTVPVKWQLLDAAGRPISTALAMNAVESLTIAGPGGYSLTVGPSGLKYDGSQFVYNWSTKGLALGNYTLTANGAFQQIQATIKLSTSGGSATLVIDGASSTSFAGALLAGDETLYVDNANGQFNADELARISDAVAGINAVVAPYGASIVVVDASVGTEANIVLTANSTSVLGGMAEGVLGVTENGDRITLVTGWNWYAGAVAAGIGATQYDFQTIVTHEIGHALGLGHRSESASVMHPMLDTARTSRVMVVADLNVQDGDGGADALRAVPVGAMAVAFLATADPSGTWGAGSHHRVAVPATDTVAPGLVGESANQSPRDGLDGEAVAAVLELAYRPDSDVPASVWTSKGRSWVDGDLDLDQVALADQEAVDRAVAALADAMAEQALVAHLAQEQNA